MNIILSFVMLMLAGTSFWAGYVQGEKEKDKRYKDSRMTYDD